MTNFIHFAYKYTYVNNQLQTINVHNKILISNTLVTYYKKFNV